MKDMAACRAIAVHHDQATEHADQGRSYELSWAAAAAAGGGTRHRHGHYQVIPLLQPDSLTDQRDDVIN